ncbi:MAG: fibrobacter succinogenes major paralogous domain-containing protein [Bacteroidales bacterium]
MKNKAKFYYYPLIVVGFLLIFTYGCKKSDDSSTVTPTPVPTTVTDIDGNVYQTVTVGTQVWLKQNLKVSRFRNGDTITNVTDGVTWSNITTAACCDFGNNSSNSITYGRLYNFYAANDSRKIAPLGWHVSTDADWTKLKTYLGGDNIAGGKLKETGTLHWSSPNTAATNSSGFTAIPGGFREMDGSFDNSNMLRVGIYWTTTSFNSTSAWYLALNYDAAVVGRDKGSTNRGYSLRCVKD